MSVDVLISILEFFRKIEYSFNADFLSSALKLIQDESWRVRYTAADRFSKIARNFTNNELDLFQLIDPFISLMKDHEGEVRKVITNNCQFSVNY